MRITGILMFLPFIKCDEKAYPCQRFKRVMRVVMQDTARSHKLNTIFYIGRDGLPLFFLLLLKKILPHMTLFWSLTSHAAKQQKTYETESFNSPLLLSFTLVQGLASVSASQQEVGNKSVPGLKNGMDYVRLGDSDLVVSKVCMGTVRTSYRKENFDGKVSTCTFHFMHMPKKLSKNERLTFTLPPYPAFTGSCSDGN